MHLFGERMIKKFIAIFFCCVSTFVSAQVKLPACTGDFVQSDWSDCYGSYDWGSYIYTGGFSKNRPNGQGEKRKPDGTLIASGIWEDGELKKSTPVDPERCPKNPVLTENCLGKIEFQNWYFYVGILRFGVPNGDGIIYFSDGVFKESGLWKLGELVEKFPISSSRFPFNENSAELIKKSLSTELEKVRLPEQRITFCVQTVQVSGTRYPSISLPYCQESCAKTYADRMCSEIGGNKWRIQTTSPKTSPPNSQYFSGVGSCACIGQEYVLNEIKETPPPVASPAPANTVQADLREAELAKREKAIADREKALLEAENKRLRDELEAERKKKK